MISRSDKLIEAGDELACDIFEATSLLPPEKSKSFILRRRALAGVNLHVTDAITTRNVEDLRQLSKEALATLGLTLSRAH